MNEIINLHRNWKLIKLRSKDHFKASVLIQHHALQFLAMAEKHLSARKKNNDDILLHWSLAKNMVVGGWLEAEQFPFRVGLSLDSLEIMLLKPPSVQVAKLNMQGKTKEEVFEWLDNQLYKIGVKYGRLSMDLLYSIPYHKTEEGIPFEIYSKDEMIELSSVRNNSELIFRYLYTFVDGCKPISISPVTFNSTSVIPLELSNNKKPEHLVNIGFAMPDSLIDHCYFYATLLNNHTQDISYEDIQQLNGEGYWIITDHLSAILPLYKFYADNQKAKQIYRVLSFYVSALNNIFDMLLVPEYRLSRKELYGNKIFIFSE
ncbi:MAG: hypothetical protein R6U04_12075 [Bacteroidales bacterium]